MWRFHCHHPYPTPHLSQDLLYVTKNRVVDQRPTSSQFTSFNQSLLNWGYPSEQGWPGVCPWHSQPRDNEAFKQVKRTQNDLGDEWGEGWGTTRRDVITDWGGEQKSSQGRVCWAEVCINVQAGTHFLIPASRISARADHLFFQIAKTKHHPFVCWPF